MSAKRNALILGAGFLQGPAIAAAKNSGCRAVVVDADSGAPCARLADEFFQIDLRDKEGIFNLARSLSKSGGGLASIFTAGTDFSSSVSFSGEKLGLRCHAFEAAMNATVKTRMRECFDKALVPSPKFFALSASPALLGDAREAARTLGFPCVVKPADNMGARGCRLARSMEEVEVSVESAAENSRGGGIIIEEYMEGPEYSIDAVIFDGTMTITGFADRHICFEPYFVETGHTMPTCADEKTKAVLSLAFARAAKALGLSCGAAKADIKMTARGPMVGEVAARLSGGYMSGWTFPYSSGLNLTEQAFLVSCGEKPDALERARVPLDLGPLGNEAAPFKMFFVPCGEVCAERAWISIPGEAKEILGLDEARSVPGVKDVFPRAKAGCVVSFPRNNVQKCGNVISLATSRESAISSAEAAVSRVAVSLEPRVKATDDFLAGKTAAGEEGFPPSAFPLLRADSARGEIPKGFRVSDALRLLRLDEDAAESKDWSHRSLAATCAAFDALRPRHAAMDARTFWRAVSRGGLQGALYAADSAEALQ